MPDPATYQWSWLLMMLPSPFMTAGLMSTTEPSGRGRMTDAASLFFLSSNLLRIWGDRVLAGGF